MYLQQDFNHDVYNAILKKTGRSPSQEECKAVAHHMEYNVRADKNFANNGHLTISTQELQHKIVDQINKNLHANDLPRYTNQYRNYKETQRYSLLTSKEKSDISVIAQGEKTVSDFNDKDYLKKIYTKYFNQALMPKIEKISFQKKNNLKYHGLWHTEQVALLSIDIAIKENQNPLPILLAAALHDCARTTDGPEPEHGRNARPIAEEFFKNYSDCDLVSTYEEDKIIEAIAYHNSSSRPRNNSILDCLQDADSMRLLWSGRQCFTPNTASGQKLAQLAPHEQIKYMASLIETMRATTLYNKGNLGNSFTR